MKKLLLLFSLFSSLNVFAVGASIDCSGPMAAPTPEDYELAPKWCTNQAAINYYWNVYKLGAGDWSKWGKTNLCDPRYGLVRFINSLYKIEQLSGQNYNYHDGYSLWIKDHARINDWAGFLRGKDVQGFRPKCADSTTLLGHQNSTWIPVDITQNALYYRNTDILGAVAIHEITHNDIDHISDSDCMNKASCDTAPGDYNATTTELYYLVDVMNTFKRADNGSLMLSLSKLGEFDANYDCNYVGVSSYTDRTLDYSFVMYKLFNNYKNTVNSGISSEFIANSVMFPGQAIFNNSFTCEFCNINSFDFKPARKYMWGNDPSKVVTIPFIWDHSCNEAHNDDNFGINLRNKVECSIIKSKIDDYAEGNYPMDIPFFSNLANQAQALGKNCAQDNVDNVKSYCDSIINASDSDLDNIDKYGIYTSHEHKFWPAVHDAAQACCNRLKEKNMTFKMTVLNCSSL